MKKILLVLALLAVAAGVAAVVFLQQEPPADEKDLYISFNTMPIEHGTLLNTVGGTGTIQPREVVAITTDRPGVVVEILKDFGDKVREGEEVLRLDDRMARRQLEQARQVVQTAAASVLTADSDLAYRQKTEELARLEYDEYQKEGYSPTQRKAKELDLERAKYAVKTAELAGQVARKRQVEAEQAVKTAELNVDLTHVRMPYIDRQPPSAANPDRTQETGSVLFTPIPGRSRGTFTVIDRKVSLNQTVGPPAATLLFTVANNPEEVEILAQINEGDIHPVKVGQEAVYSVSALQDSYFKGRVTEIRPLPVTGQGSVSYLVMIRGPNQAIPDTKAKHPPAPGCLRAGMTTASLDIIVDRYKDVGGKEPWLVPNAALDYSLDEHYLPKGVTKDYRKTPPDWKKRYVDDRKDDDDPTPRVIWLYEPQPKEGDETPEKPRKHGAEAARPVHVLIGKTGKFFDEKRPWLGLQDYSQVVETLPADQLPGDPPYKAIISDKKPAKKPGWFHLPDLGRVVKF